MRRAGLIVGAACVALLVVGVLWWEPPKHLQDLREDAVIQAARAGDTAYIHMLCDGGAHPNTADKWGFVPLYYAVAVGRTDAARELLETGGDVDWRTGRGWSLLHIAACGDDEGMVQLLLQHGADPDARTARGWTPLHVACFTGNEAGALTLIEHAADLHARTDKGSTPLHIAASAGAEQVVAWHLELGAATDAKDAAGQTPLDVAVLNGWPDVASLLRAHKQ